jgi:Ca2+-binding EF-hand superfamily protein
VYVEYKQLCAELGRSGLSDKDAAAGLIALDKNKDGQIDFNEFVDWLRYKLKLRILLFSSFF